MECVEEVFPVILYVLGAILLVILIVLAMRLLKTLRKVDHIIEDVQDKSSKIDGVFDLVAQTTDAVSILSNKIIEATVGFVTGWLSKKKRGNEENE